MKRLIAIPLVALVSVPLLAGDGSRADAGLPLNVLYTITIDGPGLASPEAPQSVRVLAIDGKRTRLQSGWRIPVPVTCIASETDAGDRTSIQYQEIGLSASLEGHIVAQDRIRLGGGIELSSVPSDQTSVGSPFAPRIGTVSQQFEVMLKSGEPTLLAELPRPDGTVLTLTISAAIQN